MDDKPYMRTLFISDEAYEQLQALAQEAGFIGKQSSVARGLSNYVTELLHRRTALRDTRPDDVREQDTDRIEAGYAREWTKYSPRRRRSIKLTASTLVNACDAAYTLGISSAVNLFGAPDPFDGLKSTSLLLEALGTGWVTYDG